MKPLDLADKYPPAESFDDDVEDDDTTVRIQVPTFIPQMVVGDEGEDDYDTWGVRDTIPCPPPYPHPHVKREINWGAIASLVFVAAFWGSIAYVAYVYFR